MATLFWSELFGGTLTAFGSGDTLVFDDPPVSASGVLFFAFDGLPTFTVVDQSVADRKVAGLGPISFEALGSANFSFGGGLLLIGDDDPLGSNDGAANLLMGGAGADHLIGLGGDDTLDGGDADMTAGSLDAVSYALSPSGVVVDLAAGQATDGHGGTDTLVGINKAFGSFHSDSIVGSDDPEIYEWFEGLGGNDVIAGGGGFDVVSYEFSPSSVSVDLTAGIASDGWDWLDGFGTDTLSGVEAVIGSLFADSIVGSASDDLIDGNYGEDTLLGGGGDDTLMGDGGKSYLFGEDGNDLLINEGGDAELYGGDGSDTLQGSSSSERLEGGRGFDVLEGGAGDDFYVLEPIPALAGGGIAYISDTVVEQFEELSTDSVFSIGSYTLGPDVEGLSMIGEPLWRPYEGRGNELDNYVIYNGLARARLYGEGGDDFLQGGHGSDSLFGGAGADGLLGGPGNDAYFLLEDVDTVNESFPEWGVDTVYSAFNYVLPVNVENLVLLEGALSGGGNELANVITGNDQSNTLIGHNGNDFLDGGLGDDTLVGGVGQDTLRGDAGNDYYEDAAGDVVFEEENAGIDTISSKVSYVLPAHFENLILMINAQSGTGNEMANVITGSNVAVGNTLIGLGGEDTLDGGPGSDTVSGGEDADRLIGGAGEDYFIFDTAPSGDQILDFISGEDHIVIDSAVFTAFTAPGTVIEPSMQQGVEAEISATSGNEADGFNDFLKYATDTGNLYYDADGVGPGGLSLIATVYSDGTNPVSFQLWPVPDIVIV